MTEKRVLLDGIDEETYHEFRVAVLIANGTVKDTVAALMTEYANKSPSPWAQRIDEAANLERQKRKGGDKNAD